MTKKEEILLELFTRGDITSDEYTNHLINEGFTDADAMKRKGIEDIIRRGEEDLKKGNVESWEDTLKKLRDARIQIQQRTTYNK